MDVSCSNSYHRCHSSCLHSSQEEGVPSVEDMAEGVMTPPPCRATRLPMGTAQPHGLVSCLTRVLPSMQRTILYDVSGALHLHQLILMACLVFSCDGAPESTLTAPDQSFHIMTLIMCHPCSAPKPPVDTGSFGKKISAWCRGPSKPARSILPVQCPGSERLWRPAAQPQPARHGLRAHQLSHSQPAERAWYAPAPLQATATHHFLKSVLLSWTHLKQPCQLGVEMSKADHAAHDEIQ